MLRNKVLNYQETEQKQNKSHLQDSSTIMLYRE